MLGLGWSRAMKVDAVMAHSELEVSRRPALEHHDALPVQQDAPLGLTAELVQQRRVGLAEEGALNHHIAEALNLRQLVLVTGKAPVGSLERVGGTHRCDAAGEVGSQVVLGADGCGRADESQRLTAGLIEGSILGWAGEVPGPWRRAHPVVDVAGDDHHSGQ
jgi:hypothetical protein